jgi:hypothetical protein
VVFLLQVDEDLHLDAPGITGADRGDGVGPDEQAGVADRFWGGRTCIQSNSRMKFSYCLAVRRKPVGLPVVTIMLSLTKNVSGAQLTLTQPVRSRPLKRGTKPSSPPPVGVVKARVAARAPPSAAKRIAVMASP